MRGERAGNSFQATALVHEAYLRLVDTQHVNWQNRAHFLAMAARLMRRILVDLARARQYQKRGGGAIRVSFTEALSVPDKAEDLVALDEALSALAKFDERRSRVVELRFFGGLSVEETAAVLRDLARDGHARLEARPNVAAARVAEMTPERWKQVSRIYHDALARDSGERASFLREACQDEALRQEVESLLAQPASTENFLGEPAVAMAAGADGAILPSRRSPDRGSGLIRFSTFSASAAWARVPRAGHQARIAMWRSRSCRALFSADPERLARFEREARLLASLNDPHIAAIYGFEETADIHALVLEFVEGPTLAERMRRGPMPLEEALRIARQIAAGLEAAHSEASSHRDLKPQNIKVKPDGTVKVLDFGLAKATMAEAHEEMWPASRRTSIARAMASFSARPAT